MFINKECELHDMLGLHKRDYDGRCQCGVVIMQDGKKLLPDDMTYAELLLGEDVLRRVACGTCNETDYSLLKRYNLDASDRCSFTDLNIGRMAESAQAQFLPIAKDLYLKTSFPIGEALLRDNECLELAKHRWQSEGTMLVQAKAPISLGWNFIAETDTNITNGNKARIYERDGVIAIQHAKRLTKLSDWKMKCKQLFVLLGKVCSRQAILSQCNLRTRPLAAKYALK